MIIISSNIRFDNPKDKYPWEQRKLLLKSIVESYQVEVLGTQEGRQDQLASLNSLLQLEIVDSHRSWIQERMYPSFFINPKNVRPLQSGDIWLSKTPNIPGSSSFDSAFPRLATWLKAEVFGYQLLFVNTHLDHQKSSTRNQQIEVLINEVSKIQDNLPLFIMGDFNEPPHSKVYKSILEKCQLIDPWMQMRKKEEASYHRFDKIIEGKRIDWIFVDPRIQLEKIFFDQTQEKGLYPSDHYPLVLQCGQLLP